MEIFAKRTGAIERMADLMARAVLSETEPRS